MFRKILALTLLAVALSSPQHPARATGVGYPGAATFSGPQRCEESFVADYGADNTGSNDCASAFSAFLATGNQYLYLPAGTYYFNMGSQGSFSVAHDVTITGAGEGSTTIVLGPDYPSVYYFFLNVTSPCAVSLQGVTVTGPAHPTYNTQIESSPWTVLVNLPVTGSSNATKVTLDHVAWSNIVYALTSASGGDSSPTTVTISNCLGSSWAQAVAFYRGDTTGNAISVYDSTFTRWGKGPSGQYYGHCLYVHDHIGLDVTRCRFDNSATPSYQFAIKYGSSGWGSTVPSLCRIAACEFAADGAVQLDGNASMAVTDTTFGDTNAYLYFGDNGFSFSNCSLTAAVVYGPSYGGEFTFSGCSMSGGEWIWASGADITYTGGSFTGGLWKFYGATETAWSGTTFSGGHIYSIQGRTGSDSYSSCTYSGTTWHAWDGSGYTSASAP